MSDQFIHSEEHLLAAEISDFCGERKRFNLYLGTILRIGKQKAYQIFSEMKQREREYLYKPVNERPPVIKNRGRYFIWKAKNG